MIEWFKNLDPAVQAAIVTAIGGVIGYLIKGFFSLGKNKKEQSSTIVKQKQGMGNKGTQIGIQNNYGSCDSIKGEEKNE